jgi:hypothetical protein
LVDVANDQKDSLVGHCLYQRLHQQDIDHGVSSTTSKSQSSGLSSPRTVASHGVGSCLRQSQ